MADPWEQITGETPKAFRGFTHYRDLGAERRSLRNAAAMELGLAIPVDVGKLSAADGRKLENGKRRYETYSIANFWVERSGQYDAHQDRLRLAARDRAVTGMVDRHAELGRLLQARAIKALGAISNAGREVGERSDRVVLAFAVEGARLERMAYGLAGDDPIPVMGTIPQERTLALLQSDPGVVAAVARLALAQAKAKRTAPAIERMTHLVTVPPPTNGNGHA